MYGVEQCQRWHWLFETPAPVPKCGMIIASLRAELPVGRTHLRSTLLITKLPAWTSEPCFLKPVFFLHVEWIFASNLHSIKGFPSFNTATCVYAFGSCTHLGRNIISFCIYFCHQHLEVKQPKCHLLHHPLHKGVNSPDISLVYCREL